MTLNPTPPRPTTRAVEPGSTCAVLITAPMPVGARQPTTGILMRSMSGSSGMQPSSGMTTYSLKPERKENCVIFSPFLLRMRLEPSSRSPLSSRAPRSQSWPWPETHDGQWPQDGIHDMTILSPTLTRVTFSPTCSTMPTPSWPRTAGYTIG